MIVDEIDVARSAAVETEDDAPVGAHRDRPEAFQVALERVQLEQRLIHAFDRLRRVERGQRGVADWFRCGSKVRSD